MGARRNRLLVEQAIVETGEGPKKPRSDGRARTRAARSVTVNLAESPLGWLKAHGRVTARQYDAGERLREDWERAQLGPNVTMSWDSAPVGRSARCAPVRPDLAGPQLAARRRFDCAVKAVGGGLGDILWRIVCAGEGMREAERALGWPARAGKLVLTMALDRLADHYRMR